MGILDKAKEIKDTIFDFSGHTRGSLAAQKLIDEGQIFINDKRDRVEESMSFLADEKQKLDAGKFSSSQIREALIYHEVERRKKELEGSNRVYDPVQIREELLGPGKFDELVYKPHMEKRAKAVEFKLPSGMSYTSENIEEAVDRFTEPQRQLFNKLAKDIYNSYGWDKDLANVLGIGKDRDLEIREIGNYDFLMQEENNPIKRAFIKQITSEINAGKGRYSDIDSKELRELYGQFSSNLSYRPNIDVGDVNMGDMRTNEATEKYNKTLFDGSMEEELSEKNVIVLNQDTDSVADDIPVTYGDLFKSRNLTGANKFQEDLNVTSAFIANIFNKAELVPKGGFLNPKDVVEIAVSILVGMQDENGNKNLDFSKTENYGFTTDIEATYTEMSPRQISQLFDMLPGMLNAFAETEQLSDVEMERINNEITFLKGQERNKLLEEDPNHPINFANNVVNTMKFNSIEERKEYIQNEIPNFAKKYTDEDIQIATQIMETTEIVGDSTEALLGTPEEITPVEIVNVFDIATDQEKSEFIGSEKNRYNDAIKKALRFSSQLESKDFLDSAKPSQIEMITNRLERSKEEIDSIIENRGTSLFIDPVKGIKKAGEVVKESLLVSDKDRLKDFTIPNLKRSLNNKDLSNKRRRELEKELEDAENKLKELE